MYESREENIVNDQPTSETILENCPLEVSRLGGDVALALTNEKVCILLNPATALSVAYSLFGAALDQLPPGYEPPTEQERKAS